MKLIFNPFERFRENQLLISGFAITALGSVLGYIFKARFDGVLDLHFVDSVLWFSPFFDNIINIVCASAVFFLAGYIINKKTRFVDVLVFSIIARAPLYLLTFFNAGGIMSSLGEKVTNNIKTNPLNALEGSDLMTLIIFGLLSIIFIIWHVTLLYNGYRVASNAKGVKAIILFILAILVAEIISKILISLIP
jgi:hypothetical protein